MVEKIKVILRLQLNIEIDILDRILINETEGYVLNCVPNVPNRIDYFEILDVLSDMDVQMIGFKCYDSDLMKILLKKPEVLIKVLNDLKTKFISVAIGPIETFLSFSDMLSHTRVQSVTIIANGLYNYRCWEIYHTKVDLSDKRKMVSSVKCLSFAGSRTFHLANGKRDFYLPLIRPFVNVKHLILYDYETTSSLDEVGTIFDNTRIFLGRYLKSELIMPCEDYCTSHFN